MVFSTGHVKKLRQGGTAERVETHTDEVLQHSDTEVFQQAYGTEQTLKVEASYATFTVASSFQH